MLLVDKPAGVTSHDVVQQARRIYGERSIGHLGTLDPFATGLLILLLGRATRLANFLTIEPKIYEATIQFGVETDTDDSTGSAVRRGPVPAKQAVEAAIRSLTGTISQVPPAYSAKSIDGTRAYDAARRGEPLELVATTVTVHSWELTDVRDDLLRATITCGSGTYIRALARDLGRLTSSAAHLGALRRIRIGDFDLSDATPLSELADSPPRLRRLRVIADE